MAGFDQLHPLLVHHIVNSLGWSGLRPLQEAAIAPVLAGEDVVLLAPTAGGKTEAALFPVLSALLSRPARGLRVVYLCPIKALLNNLGERVEAYARMLGLRAAVWHGDTPERLRREIRKEPPDLLLTTPESLEVLLISARVDNQWLFQNVAYCIVDEIHAFAGDDRGLHLIALLARLAHYAPEPLQRVGLSATVGNPDVLLAWLQRGSGRPGRVLRPEGAGARVVDVQLDFVGSLENAATVIAALHRGEKRLVFCDSRARVESLAGALRARGVETFVSHGSLGVEERRAAEEAFAQGENCVIVATSTLELGIDVGDLDRVIQIDAPGTVASFLQRLGRTGRRAGSVGNCLFLATSEEALLRAAGLLWLWGRGEVEPVVPPPLPYHLVAQQMMALCLERGALSIKTLLDALVPVFGDITRDEMGDVLAFLLAMDVLLMGDDALIWMGDEGQVRYGQRHFLELVSVFTSPPLFVVVAGQREIGQVHESSFEMSEGKKTVLSLGGFSWQVTGLDWRRRVAFVMPSQEAGKSRWLGGGVHQHFRLSRAVAAVLGGAAVPVGLSQRAESRLAEARAELSVQPGDWLGSGGSWTWWTFAGTRYNGAVTHALKEKGFDARCDAYSVTVRAELSQAAALKAALDQLIQEPPTVPLDEAQLKGLKFSESLPRELIENAHRARHAIEEEAASMRELGCRAPSV